VAEESAQDAEAEADPPRASRTPPPAEEDERAARLRKRFEDDPPGESDARKFEDDYRRVFLRPSAQGATLESIECHRAVCKAVVVLDNSLVHNRLFIDAMRESGMSRYAATVGWKEKLADGKSKVTVYVAQSGGLH
jgi:hypothetical protein